MHSTKLSHIGALVRPSRKGRCGANNARASFSSQRGERILRYPDGNVRRIRYPEPLERLEEAVGVMSAEEDEGESWGICRETDAQCQIASGLLADEGLPGAAPSGLLWVDEIRTALDTFRGAPSATPPSPDAAAAPPAELPSSPAELLAFLQSPEYIAQQRRMAERVALSYRVLTGSPWLHAKPVLVIAMARAHDEPPSAYTLPTRVPRQEQASELAKVLGIPGLDVSLSVDDVRDGVLCFEHEREAAAFRDMMEADGHLEVLVTEVDSHELFRMASDVDAVVVLLGQGDLLPRPSQLAGALRGGVAMDDFL